MPTPYRPPQPALQAKSATPRGKVCRLRQFQVVRGLLVPEHSTVKTKTAVFLILGLLLAATASVCALGIRIPNQDAEANARGNAFVATADNPSAIYYNPAGITQLKGHMLQAGALAYLNVYTDYQSADGARTENDPEIIPVPQLHYVFSPEGSPFAFGLG